MLFLQKKTYFLIKKDHDSPPPLGFFETKKFNQQFAPGEEAEEADLWLIFLRFALQPCRVFASAANARKVQQMQKGCVAWLNIFVHPLESETPEKPTYK